MKGRSSRAKVECRSCQSVVRYAESPWQRDRASRVLVGAGDGVREGAPRAWRPDKQMSFNTKPIRQLSAARDIIPFFFAFPDRTLRRVFHSAFSLLPSPRAGRRNRVWKWSVHIVPILLFYCGRSSSLFFLPSAIWILSPSVRFLQPEKREAGSRLSSDVSRLTVCNMHLIGSHAVVLGKLFPDAPRDFNHSVKWLTATKYSQNNHNYVNKQML